ncbi:MAG: ROK family protein [Eubacteriales bacterium]
MEFLGLSISLANTPSLDPDFIPMGKFNTAFLQGATVPFSIALEGLSGQMAVYHSHLYGTKEKVELDRYYLRRLMKTMLWLYGGYQFYLSGCPDMVPLMAEDFSKGGIQEFDWDYMANIFEHPFAIQSCDKVPEAVGNAQAIGRHLEGCRIGFDAGGSDRKVSAVKDGEVLFSEEVVWHPKTQSDPDYHYDGIVSALKAAASHLPKVDAVGISSAGVYLDNQCKSASLFLKVPPDLFAEKVKNIYGRAVEDSFGKVPYAVCNDGDVSALAGAMSLGEDNVLGIAMGTSEAVGFVDQNGCITGWLNELAFVPVDASPTAMVDEWSGDIGCGVKYFSQDAVIKLAPKAGITLDEGLSPAEKLKVVQALMAEEDERAKAIFQSIGVYLGHSLGYYHHFYHFAHVLLLGRVMSGKGGDIILAVGKKVLAEEYPEVEISLALPDEKSRRVGQSVAAASLPKA